MWRRLRLECEVEFWLLRGADGSRLVLDLRLHCHVKTTDSNLLRKELDFVIITDAATHLRDVYTKI